MSRKLLAFNSYEQEKFNAQLLNLEAWFSVAFTSTEPFGMCRHLTVQARGFNTSLQGIADG